MGRKVIILILDDESDTNKAKELYRSMILEKKVDLVLGPYSSAILAAIAPIVDEFGYPTLAPASAADSIWEKGYKNIFGMLTRASRYSIGILSLALLYDLKKVAIVYADDEFSTEVAKGAKKWTPHLGLEIVMFEEFKKGTKDLVPLAQKARDNGAELVLVGGHFNESVNMRLALKKINWYPKAFFATVGPALQKYKETLGIDAEFTFSTSIWEPHETSNSPQAIKFTNAFVECYQQEPSYHAAQAFAAGQILNAAVELAGGLDRDKIRNALFELDTQCIIGRYTVDKRGMQKRWYPLTIQWQNGKKKIVFWPDKEIRLVAPVFK